jgi:hypothetical protein
VALLSQDDLSRNTIAVSLQNFRGEEIAESALQTAWEDVWQENRTFAYDTTFNATLAALWRSDGARQAVRRTWAPVLGDNLSDAVVDRLNAEVIVDTDRDAFADIKFDILNNDLADLDFSQDMVVAGVLLFFQSDTAADAFTGYWDGDPNDFLSLVPAPGSQGLVGSIIGGGGRQADAIGIITVLGMTGVGLVGLRWRRRLSRKQ